MIEAGGMCETSIAEDFLTSLFIHEKKWKSVYVDEVLAEGGLAPEDFLSYYKQQFRWARGSLEVIFKYNPLFRRGLTMSQRAGSTSRQLPYLSGLIVLLNATLPLIYFSLDRTIGDRHDEPGADLCHTCSSYFIPFRLPVTL